MTLYLVQHGDALPKEADPERPLSPRGRADVERMAAFLGGRGVRAARVVHSGKARARQTAELLAAALAPGAAAEAAPGLDPNDPAGPWAERAAEADGDTMLVGHMPFMGRLAALLVAGDETADVAAFTPGSVLCLDPAEEPGGAGAWRVAWMLRPELAG